MPDCKPCGDKKSFLQTTQDILEASKDHVTREELTTIIRADGTVVTPTFRGVHDLTKTYVPLDVVTDTTGVSWTAKKVVPVNTALVEGEFWTVENGMFANDICTVDTLTDLVTADKTKLYVVKSHPNGGIFIFDPARVLENDGGTIINGWVRQFSGALNILWFVNDDGTGVKNDGTGDNTTGIQKAINMGTSLYMPAGTYRTTSELVMKDGCKLRAEGSPNGYYAQVTDQAWENVGSTIIKYDGVAGDDICVLRVSDYAVGTEPTGTQLTISNSAVVDVGIDGNNKAGIGAYYVRPDGTYTNIGVRGTTKHGHLFMQAAGVTFTDLKAIGNSGCGMTIGKNIWGWANQFTDECVFVRPMAAWNGGGTVWDENTAFDAGYGIGIYKGRGLTFIGTQVSQNIGVGIYYNSKYPNVDFNGGYSEFNCRLHSTRYEIGITSTAASYSLIFRNINIRGKARIKGVSVVPSAGAIVFDSCSFIDEIKSDIDNYRIVNGNSDTNFSLVKPRQNVGVVNNYVLAPVIGAFSFDASNGLIENAKFNGSITGITYAGEGIYDIKYSNVQSADVICIPHKAYPLGTITTVSTGQYSTRLRNRDGGGTIGNNNAKISGILSIGAV